MKRNVCDYLRVVLIFLVLLNTFTAIWAEDVDPNKIALPFYEKIKSNQISIGDAKQLISFLNSNIQNEVKVGLHYISYVHHKFPDARRSIEDKVISRLNNPKEKMRYLAAETILNLPISKEKAKELTIIPNENEINLVKSLIKERLNIYSDTGAAFIIANSDSSLLNKEARVFEAGNCKENLIDCTLFREIANILFYKHYYKLAFGFYKIIVNNPEEFTPHCVDEAKSKLRKYESENPVQYPDTFDGKQF